MLSGEFLGNIFKSLPRPILYGILTAIALAHFGDVATPQLGSITEDEHGKFVSAMAKYLRVGIALMPTPIGFAVFVYYTIKDTFFAFGAQRN